MKLKYYIQTGVVALAAATVGVSCTDTWDDHYSVNGTVPGATLWENMQLDESIRPFVRVLDSCGYKDILNANQVFTVWAPEITASSYESHAPPAQYRRGGTFVTIKDNGAWNCLANISRVIFVMEAFWIPKRPWREPDSQPGFWPSTSALF